jgi:hypothetical protein
MVKRGDQHEDATPDSKKDSKKRSRTTSIDTKEEKRSRSSLIDTKEERRQAKPTDHTTKSAKEERKSKSKKKDQTDKRETKKETKKETKEPVEPPTANKRRKHNVVVVISDDDADEMIVVDDDNVFQTLPYDIDVRPAPQRHSKEQDAPDDEEAEEADHGSGEAGRSTRRERQDDTLREHDPLLDVELSQRMTRAMTESHSLNFADICSIDAKFKEIMETVRVRAQHYFARAVVYRSSNAVVLTHLIHQTLQGYVYDESKTDFEDLKSMASKLLALLDTLGTNRLKRYRALEWRC